MKNIFKILMLLVIVTTASCKQDYQDHMTGTASTGGAIIDLDAQGKLLGTPQTSDLETSPLTINDADVELDLNDYLKFGGQDVEKYEIFKSFNGGSSSLVVSSTTLPINVTYNSVSDYLDGTSVSDPLDLRVGDTFTFITAITKKDGSVSYPVNGKYTITVACASDLAYDYAVAVLPSSGSSVNQGIETLRELGPGMYKTTSTGHWPIGLYRPDQGFIFNDLCNSITVPTQNLFDYYTNKVYQTEDQINNSYVDPATGNLHIEYSISFDAGDLQYVADYIKQ